jgi:hypothetical protein|tara:strand:+ start:1862 stop:2161 length:300 start_codon:yes stop_codon:yes gene_type:complete
MIQAHNPMIIGDAKNVAVTFQSGQKVLSLSLDNSCGRMENLRRGSILLMIEDETGNSDVTAQVFEDAKDGHAVHASLGNFETAMNWLSRCSWGLEAHSL